VIAVVIDTGVIISAIGWRGPAHRCLALVARRQCRLVVSADIIAEYDSRVPAVLAQEAPQANAFGALAWIRAKALWVEPAPLGRQRSRDVKDERFIAAALSANAKASDLVNQAYALTPSEIALMWQTAPPRMPIPPPCPSSGMPKRSQPRSAARQ